MASSHNIGPWSNLEAQRRRVSQVQENSSRLAQSFARVQTTNVGMVAFPHVQRFGCTFAQRPAVHYSFSMDPDSDDMVDGDFPICQGGVFKWQYDARGYYVGAWVHVNVDAGNEYILNHDFTFTGVAQKQLPEHLLEQFKK